MNFSDDTARDLVEAIARLRKAEETIKDARAYIQDKMGDAVEMTVGSHRVTWAHTNGRATVDWRTLAIKLGVTQSAIDKHTVVGSPGRRFVIR